jgi:hypothetical protein
MSLGWVCVNHKNRRVAHITFIHSRLMYRRNDQGSATSTWNPPPMHYVDPELGIVTRGAELEKQTLEMLVRIEVGEKRC